MIWVMIPPGSSLAGTPGNPRARTPEYARASAATPVYGDRFFPNTIGFANNLNRRVRLYHSLLFTAYPNTAFTVLDRQNVGGVQVVRVTTAEYPCQACYVDARNLAFAGKPFPERQAKLPSRRAILQFLENAAARGVPYCWGCNFTAGVPSMRRDYALTARQLARYPWDFAGLDCSGILFEATDGVTPRDTNRLLVYGDPVPVKGKSEAQIRALLQPLDLIIWQGHMLIVLENGFVVESANRYRRQFVRKAIKSPLAQRLGEIVWQRRPVNNYYDMRFSGAKRFVVRRWYGINPAPAAGVRP